MTIHTAPQSPVLPTTIREFLAAHIVRDPAASSFFTDDAVVTDQGESVRGREQVHAFLRDAGSEFDYTTERIDTRRIDDDHWVVTLRLEGTFPGGVAALDYMFTLQGDLIADLDMSNHPA